MVRSRSAMTIRNLDQASHAQNSTVLRPSMTGPCRVAPAHHYAEAPSEPGERAFPAPRLKQALWLRGLSVISGSRVVVPGGCDGRKHARGMCGSRPVCRLARDG